MTMIHITKRELEEVLDRKLRPIYRALGLLTQEVTQMDAAGEALKQKIEGLDADVVADNEAVVKGATAIASAGAKFAELKALLEKQASGGALSDEEAQALSTLSDEVGTHLGEATTSLDEHVTELEGDTSAA